MTNEEMKQLKLLLESYEGLFKRGLISAKEYIASNTIQLNLNCLID